MSLEVLEWYFVSAGVAIIIISCLLLVGRNFVLCSNIKDTAGAQSVAWSKRTALYLKCLRISYLLVAGLFITLSPFRTILLATFTTWECWPYLSPSPSISSCSSTRYVCVCVSLGLRDRSKSPMTPMDRFPLGAATEPVYTNSKLHFNKRESPKLSSITDAQEGRVYVLLGE